jgi:uncharacterized Zn-binding protein involved in type VI secretion
MSNIHRLGDTNDAGAEITSTKQTTVKIAGQFVATDGDPVAAHGIGEHASPETANGCATVKINDVPINHTGNEDSCGHVREDNGVPVFLCRT